MTKISVIILAMFLSPASMDDDYYMCSTCEDRPTSHICGLFSTYVACMDMVDSEASNCTYDEKSANVTSIKSAMAILGCSGASGLAPSLSLILAFTVLAYLPNNKR